MTLKTLIATALLTLLGGMSPALAASDLPAPQHVKINLYATVSEVAPGKPFTLIIEQLIDDGWHTYWLNPGDSGTPTKVKWGLPDGGTAGELQFPTPEHIPYGPLMDFGYSNRALFQATITPPTAISGETYTVKADLEWLVCKDICLPEGDEYSIVLPVGGPGPVMNTSVDTILRDLMKSHPVAVNWPATYAEQDGRFILTLTPPEASGKILKGAKEIAYFPHEWGLFLNTAEQVLVSQDDGSFVLAINRDQRPLAEIRELEGVLAVTDASGQRQGFQITATPPGGLPPLAAQDTPKTEISASDAVTTPDMPMPAVIPDGPSLIGVLFIAVLGGLILNLMPCVFPVLSLKVLSISQLSHGDRRVAQHHGVAYAAGVIVTFLLIASILIVLQQTGETIGWGFQLQQPIVVALLIYLFVVVGLNLMGWFEIDLNRLVPDRFHGNHEGLTGSFATGILATIVATPCTAPFMGAAMGYALTQNAIVALIVFAALGFGLALPFLIICFVPGLQKIMPRPGGWMVTLRQFLAFPMFLAAIWLTWVLAQQTGANGVALALIGALCIALMIWLWHHTPKGRMVRTMRIALMIIAAIGVICVTQAQHYQQIVATAPTAGEQPYTKAALDAALQSDRPIFINMTAAWCITCKVNERVALSTDAARAVFDAHNVLLLKGDWTNFSKDITDFLGHYGRNGVPLYVFIGAPDKDGKRPEPVVLPQILTPAILRETITGS